MEDEPNQERPAARGSSSSSSALTESSSSHGGPRGQNYRIIAALLWVTTQAALVLTAGKRSDGAFGFRMFSESSSLKLALFRELDGPDGTRTRVHVDGGVWSARGSDGKYRRVSWFGRVPARYWTFDQEMHASYGASAQLSRLERAVDDVASHVPISDDVETRRLVLDVTVRRNGRGPILHQLTSRERTLPSSTAGTASDGGP